MTSLSRLQQTIMADGRTTERLKAKTFPLLAYPKILPAGEHAIAEARRHLSYWTPETVGQSSCF
jgi:hypothetical protein